MVVTIFKRLVSNANVNNLGRVTVINIGAIIIFVANPTEATGYNTLSKRYVELDAIPRLRELVMIEKTNGADVF